MPGGSLIADADQRAPTTRSKYEKEGWADLCQRKTLVKPAKLSQAACAGLGPFERAQYDKERKEWHRDFGPIVTDDLQRIVARARSILEMNEVGTTGAVPGIMLSGSAASGKTTIVDEIGGRFYRQMMRKFPSGVTAGGNEYIPVIYLQTPSNATQVSFLEGILRFFNHPGVSSAVPVPVHGDPKAQDRVPIRSAPTRSPTTSWLKYQAEALVHACGTKLVILDDVHFLQMRYESQKEVVQLAKELMNRFGTTWILAGVECKVLLDEGLGEGDRAKSQTRRRFVLETTTPYSTATAEGKRRWRNLLSRIDQELVLARSEPGDLNERLVDYLFARTGGVLGSLMHLIKYGAYKAIASGNERITAALLDEIPLDYEAESGRPRRRR